MAGHHLPEHGRAPGWRRKWRRVPAEHRQVAAGSLGDFFVPARSRLSLVVAALLISLVGHAVAVPLLLSHRGRAARHIAAANQSYLQRVLQKDQAKRHSKDAKNRLTMPPPPPDPEAVVSSTLTSEITTDIERVIGGLLDVDVTSKLANNVTSDLRDELAEAAKNIAEGKLSDADIQKLQEDFKKKAHERTVSALHQHREETQLERATLSVREWYENRVASQLKAKMRFELFLRTHGGVWHHTYAHSHWGMLNLWYGDCFHYRRIVGQLSGLAAGRHYDPRGTIGGTPLRHGQRTLPDWPKPTAKSAEGLERVARRIHSGHYGHGWRAAAVGYVRGFHSHHQQALIDNEIKAIETAWARLFQAIAAFRAATQSNAPEPKRAAALKDSLAAVKAVETASAKLLHGDERACATVNQAVRSRVLRGPACQNVYRRYVDSLVEAFKPAVLDLARNEFQEGILVREKGVDAATQKFIAEMTNLLRQDVESVIPLARFSDLVFEGSVNPYISEITRRPRSPNAQDIERDEQAEAAILAKWPAERRAYPAARATVIAEDFDAVVQNVARTLLTKLVEDGRFNSRFYASVESVDYTDKVEQRLNARKQALMGRGQDLAQLTDEGVPDTAAAMVALMFGASKGHGASLQPVMTSMSPAYDVGEETPEAALSAAPPRYPPPPKSWGRVTQPKITPPFKTFKCEGIPFLANFPKLDGDLRDWGKIRPLITQPVRWKPGPKQVILIYAAWNYQGYFFGYQVDQPDHRFAYPEINQASDSFGLVMQRATGYRWAYRGDYLRLLIDTLDSRSKLRGEPHMQEFTIFPRGTEGNPGIPGIERIIESSRNATRRRGQWGEIVARTTVFPPQPKPETGPDGTGPYRVTRFTKTGYTTEVFLPRSLFKVPVFCPGWYVGFEALVAVGHQGRYPGHIYGRLWANHWWNGHGELGDKDYPHHWGDLLMLGTDPYVVVQDDGGDRAAAVVPGHSYLVTVADPDRNVTLSAEDLVVVSAEVTGGATPPSNDVEVFILKETGKNSSIFRGYINTQPGRGRQVQGVVELMPGQLLRLGYLDLANAKGQRNVIYHAELPAVAGLATTLARAP